MDALRARDERRRARALRAVYWRRAKRRALHRSKSRLERLVYGLLPSLRVRGAAAPGLLLAIIWRAVRMAHRHEGTGKVLPWGPSRVPGVSGSTGRLAERRRRAAVALGWLREMERGNFNLADVRLEQLEDAPPGARRRAKRRGPPREEATAWRWFNPSSGRFEVPPVN